MTSVPGLLLCLSGPLQSWGTRSLWNHRDSGRVPTLSAVAGMLAAAQGHPRGIPPGWADGMALAVRADRPGRLIADYHTANAGYPRRPAGGRARKSSGGTHKDTVVTTRDYLADASFAAIVTHPDPDIVSAWARAMAAPMWPPYLGRRSCPPALPPVWGTTSGDPETLLRDRLPLLADPPLDRRDLHVVYNASSSDPASWTDDRPISTDPRGRRYAPRGIAEDVWTIPADRCAGVGPTGWATIRDALTQEATTP